MSEWKCLCWRDGGEGGREEEGQMRRSAYFRLFLGYLTSLYSLTSFVPIPLVQLGGTHSSVPLHILCTQRILFMQRLTGTQSLVSLADELSGGKLGKPPSLGPWWLAPGATTWHGPMCWVSCYNIMYQSSMTNSPNYNRCPAITCSHNNRLRCMLWLIGRPGRGKYPSTSPAIDSGSLWIFTIFLAVSQRRKYGMSDYFAGHSKSLALPPPTHPNPLLDRSRSFSPPILFLPTNTPTLVVLSLLLQCMGTSPTICGGDPEVFRSMLI